MTTALVSLIHFVLRRQPVVLGRGYSVKRCFLSHRFSSSSGTTTTVFPGILFLLPLPLPLLLPFLPLPLFSGLLQADLTDVQEEMRETTKVNPRSATRSAPWGGAARPRKKEPLLFPFRLGFCRESFKVVICKLSKPCLCSCCSPCFFFFFLGLQPLSPSSCRF